MEQSNIQFCNSKTLGSEKIELKFKTLKISCAGVKQTYVRSDETVSQ